MDDVSDIAAYYNLNAAGESTRLERHQLEHNLTWRYLRRYLPDQGKLLEIGAASGGYTVDLARQGYTITGVDLSATLLKTCRQRLVKAGLEQKVKLVLADARDLSAVAELDFDAVLLMGPLYHLVFEADRKTALQEVYGRLKTGGVIFSSSISRYGIMGDLLKNVPEWIEQKDEVRSILDQGRDPEHMPDEGFRGYFARVDEIASLHEAIGFKTITLAGVEPAIASDDESFNKLEGVQRELWLDLLDEISTQTSIIGASRHLLYVGRK
jgi:S-adenosylmethionine-dependent methyltransferase